MRTCLNITFYISGIHYIIATEFVWLNLLSESKNNKKDFLTYHSPCLTRDNINNDSGRSSGLMIMESETDS